MSLHHEYARVTPYELALPGRDFAEEHLAAVAREGEERRLPLDDPGTFRVLEATERALRSIRGDGEEWGGLDPYAAILYHGFHFWRAGEPLFLLDLALARGLVEDRSAPITGTGAARGDASWAPATPTPAGYLQLPRHLFWVQPGPEAVPESVDGIFWTIALAETFSVLPISGVRDDRPGLEVMPLPPAPLADLPLWPDIRARENGRDFDNTLPGAEMDALYSFETPGEVLKLLARVFRHIAQVPDAVEEARRFPRPGHSSPDTGPLPTTLPYRMIRLAPRSPSEEP